MRFIEKSLKRGWRRFAREWIQENRDGRPTYNAMLQKEADSQIESVGSKLRGDMSWIKANQAARTTPEVAVKSEQKEAQKQTA